MGKINLILFKFQDGNEKFFLRDEKQVFKCPYDPPGLQQCGSWCPLFHASRFSVRLCSGRRIWLNRKKAEIVIQPEQKKNDEKIKITKMPGSKMPKGG